MRDVLNGVLNSRVDASGLYSSFPATQLTPAELAVFIATGTNPVVNYAYAPGHLYRYGTNKVPGTTDMTAAVNAWASLGGNLSMPIAETVLLSGTITLTGNTLLTIAEGAVFRSNTAGFSLFKAVSKTNIIIRGGTILQTATSATVHVAMIELSACTSCQILQVELIGSHYTGILLDTSSNCVVEGCYVHDSLGCSTADVDSADISIYKSSALNVISGNICYGGTAVEHGVMIQDPGGATLPANNVVTGNRVGPHKSYGILNYMITHANTYNQIIANEVEGITGTAQSGGSGMGIYNQGAGGTIIANNVVRNCCINTSAFSLIPAGITLNLDSAMQSVKVTGNHVSDIVLGTAGIAVNAGPADIVGNTVIQSSGMTTNIGIYLNTASGVNVADNHVALDTGIAAGQGIFSLAGANVTDISITGNHVTGCSSRGIRVDTSAAFTTTGLTLTGNQTGSASVNCIPLNLGFVNFGAVSGNMFTASGNTVISANSCLAIVYSGNCLHGGVAAPQVAFSGTSGSSYFDKSNFLGTYVNNQASGLITELLRNATPGAGFNSQVGDRIEQSVPVVGSPKGWRCTVNGNPGTWVSEGAL